MNKKIVKIISLFVIILFITPILTGCGNDETYEYDKKRVEIGRAEKIDMSQMLSFSATLEGSNETLIATKIPGRIKEVKVDIGDSLLEGDLLAVLSGEENYSQQNTAYNAYQNSLGLLVNTTLQMEQGIEDARASLVIAEKNLNLVKTGATNNKLVSSDRVIEAEMQLELARINRANIENSFEQRKRDVIDGMESSITQAVILSKNVLSYIYALNGYSLPDDDNYFKINSDFISKSAQLNNKTTMEVRAELKPTVYELEDFYNRSIKNKNPDENIIFQGRDLAEKTLYKVKDSLQNMSDVVINSISHISMSQEKLDQYRFELATFGSQTEALLLSQDAGVNIGILGVRQALDNLEIEKNNQISIADKRIELSEQQLNLLTKSNNATDDNYDSRLSIAEAQVSQAKQSLKTAESRLNTQVQISNNQVNVSRGILNMASISVNDTRLMAPYDGVVVEKYLDEGSVVGPGSPVLKIADISRYKLIIYVPENLIKYFYTGQEGFAANPKTPEEKYQAIIERISPKSEYSTKKIRVELGIENNNNNNLKIGMEMKLEMSLKEKDELLTIPSQALSGFYGDETVFVYRDGQVKRKIVKTGIISSRYVEIIDGLDEGDIVVISGIDNLRDGEIVEVLTDKSVESNKKIQ